MVKSYLRYELKSTIGLVNSQESSVTFDASGKLVVSAAIENVLVWNPKQGVMVGSFRGDNSEVTCLQISPDAIHVAAGHNDGSIRVYNLPKQTLTVTLQGHRKAVRTLRYNGDGSMLVSGSRDTDIIVWDVLGETGLYRLRGHKDEVTEVKFLGGNKFLVSASKDTLLKVWDLATQHCVQTCVGHRSEVWSFDVDPTETRLVSGAADNLIRVWAVNLPDDEEAAEDGMSIVAAGSSAEGGGVAGRVGVGVGAEAKVTAEVVTLIGSFRRQTLTKGRTQRVRFSRSGRVLGYQTANARVVELYKVCTERELHRKLLRKQKRAREKLKLKKQKQKQLKANAKKGGAEEEGGEEEEDAGDDPAAVTTSLADEYELLSMLRPGTTVRTFAFSPEGDAEPGAGAGRTGKAKAGKGKGKGSKDEGVPDVGLVLGMCNNSLQVHRLAAMDRHKPGADVQKQAQAHAAGAAAAAPSQQYAVALPGHHGDVRAVCLSGDDSLILSVSGHEAKVWNVHTCQCVRTLALPADVDVGLSCLFVPGDKHCVVGTKDGGVFLFDVRSGACTGEHQPHEGAVWSLALRPDGQGFATASADHLCTFWQFQMTTAPLPNGDGDGEEAEQQQQQQQLAQGGQPTVPRLVLVHSRTLKLGDDVLCVRYSHSKQSDKLLVACALMDATIKVFFEDSLKFFISLYGHKLPCLSMDVSSDDTLIATASADKNVKLWGLDFGDCHKSIFAHADSVMAIAFVPGTHYFWTCGKDHAVKYWDGDSYEQIMAHTAHAGDVWCLAVSSVGDFVVTGSHDRSVRIWERTDEPLFVEEEKEKALEAVFDADMVKDADQRYNKDTGGSGGGDASAPAGRRTLETMQAGERLLDALGLAADRQHDLDLYQKNLEAAEAKLSAEQRARRARQENPPPLAHPPPANMLMLGLAPTPYVLREMKRIKPQELEEALLVLPFSAVENLLKHLGALIGDGIEVELGARCIFFLLRTYQDQIVSNRMLVTVLDEMRTATRAQLTRQKDRIGFNLAGLQYLKRQLKADERTTNPDMKKHRV